MGKWQIRKSDHIINDRWLKLRVDTCVTPEGHTIEPYYVFEYRDWVNCMVLDDKLDVIMVKHYRHGVQAEVLEVIGGGIESTDKSPMEAIRRELAEELGYTGGTIYQTGVTYANPASHSNKVYSFIAIGGKCTLKQNLEKGESLQIRSFSIREVIAKLQSQSSGEIFQSLHITSIFFALNFIRQSSDKSFKALKALIASVAV